MPAAMLTPPSACQVQSTILDLVALLVHSYIQHHPAHHGNRTQHLPPSLPHEADHLQPLPSNIHSMQRKMDGCHEKRPHMSPARTAVMGSARLQLAQPHAYSTWLGPPHPTPHAPVFPSHLLALPFPAISAEFLLFLLFPFTAQRPARCRTSRTPGTLGPCSGTCTRRTPRSPAAQAGRIVQTRIRYSVRHRG